MKKQKIEQVEEEQAKLVPVRIVDTRRRPYGLCARVGISTQGMTPGEAWAAWDEYREEERKAKKEGKKTKPMQIVKPSKRQSAPPVKEAVKAPADRRRMAPKEPPVAPIAKPKPKPAEAPAAPVQAPQPSIPIPSLNARNIETANSNSMFDRGTVIEKDYQSYANRILSWDIADSKKEQLIATLHKKFEERLSADSQYVPWTVSGRARYPVQKMQARAERSMKKSVEISEWFEQVEESVANSQRQYQDDRAWKAKREEEGFKTLLGCGWFHRGGKLNPTALANGLAPIAHYDSERFVELYEKYDKELHFRKNTTAAKIYESIKAGTFKGAQPAQKLHESDNLNAYKGQIGSGEERVFIKFVTRPKPQLIYALKSRGYHWNSNEGAWSVPVKKYDADFVASIDERYAKYL